jgi:hypothetical protein
MQEVSIMVTAKFRDGSECLIEAVPGDGFEPHEGERYLFEFPEGTLKEGIISFDRRPRPQAGESPHHVHFDPKTRIVEVEVA